MGSNCCSSGCGGGCAGDNDVLVPEEEWEEINNEITSLGDKWQAALRALDVETARADKLEKDCARKNNLLREYAAYLDAEGLTGVQELLDEAAAR